MGYEGADLHLDITLGRIDNDTLQLWLECQKPGRRPEKPKGETHVQVWQRWKRTYSDAVVFMRNFGISAGVTFNEDATLVEEAGADAGILVRFGFLPSGAGHYAVVQIEDLDALWKVLSKKVNKIVQVQSTSRRPELEVMNVRENAAV